MKSACAQPEARCKYVDEVRAAKWDRTDFADEGHFNRHGGVQLAKILADRIRRLETSLSRSD